MEDPVVILERHLHGHPLAGLLWEKTIWESSIGTRLGKVKLLIGNVYLSTEQEDCSHQCMWTISNWQARQKTWNRLGKFSWNMLTWENQHHFSTMKIWDSLKEGVKSAMILWWTTEMFESRISAGANEKLPTTASGKLDAEIVSSLSYDMEGHAKKRVERYCEFANKTTQQLFKVAMPCMDDHQCQEEENESVRELSSVCSQIVLKCLYLAPIGRHDILWSVNKFARSITKMDKILRQTFGAFDLLHSSNMWIETKMLCGNHSTTMQTRIVSRLWFCRRLWRLKINIRRNSVHFRKSHVCAKKSDVQETDFSFTQFYRSWNHFSRCRFTHGRNSHSHCLGFGDWSISFRTEQNWWTQERATGNPSAVVKPSMHNPIPIKHTNVIATNIDHIPPSTTHSSPSSLLYVLDDNEAVIKMIVKGRSPTMRHVSRTHRAALEQLFFRIYLDSWSKSVTLTPNINSQTCWPKEISHVTSGTIFFICSTSAFSDLFAAPRILAW